MKEKEKRDLRFGGDFGYRKRAFGRVRKKRKKRGRVAELGIDERVGAEKERAYKRGEKGRSFPVPSGHFLLRV